MRALLQARRTGPLLIVTAIVVALAAAPLVAGPYFTRLAVVGLLYVASATAWDLVGGLTGQVSFGHAVFFGVGAYVTAILVREGVPMPLTMLPAAAAAAAYGAAWGWPCLRLRGPFFAIATIGVGEATRLAATLWEPVTGGATGLTLPIGGGTQLPTYYLALGLAVLAIAVAKVVRDSTLGLGLACIREDVDAAESIGIRSGLVQVQALMTSAALVGAAGSIYARYLFYVEPGDVFAFNRSIGLILMTIIGGVNSLWGPAVGAVLFLGLEQVLSA
ncbi:MAG: branched-chain amino acid ABC transporter permease, partial [Vicinamibacterales bacterium]